MTDKDRDRNFDDIAERSEAAGIADESAAYTDAIALGEEEDSTGDSDSAAGATESGRSSNAPAEGDEESAPRQPGSPG
ncbi:hypothetical protein DMC47_24195 [Nostoc sp. 3335mG]|nr:hypothetical protein DMC47_24195 [Nostoc sp. 3335mG]